MLEFKSPFEGGAREYRVPFNPKEHIGQEVPGTDLDTTFLKASYSGFDYDDQSVSCILTKTRLFQSCKTLILHLLSALYQVAPSREEHSLITSARDESHSTAPLQNGLPLINAFSGSVCELAFYVSDIRVSEIRRSAWIYLA